MINASSRDPITLWNDLAVSWLSGSEKNWIDEREGSKYFTYSNLFVCRWDYLAVDGEGERLRQKCALPKEEVQMMEVSNSELPSFQLNSWGEIQILKKVSGQIQIHAYLRSIELTRGLMSFLHCANSFLKKCPLHIQPMTPIAIHTTRAYFSRVNLPYLYLIYGRRAFFSLELSGYLNKDISHLKKILSKSYQAKAHQRAWKHVVDIVGLENII